MNADFRGMKQGPLGRLMQYNIPLPILSYLNLCRKKFSLIKNGSNCSFDTLKLNISCWKEHIL